MSAFVVSRRSLWIVRHFQLNAWTRLTRAVKCTFYEYNDRCNLCAMPRDCAPPANPIHQVVKHIQRHAAGNRNARYELHMDGEDQTVATTQAWWNFAIPSNLFKYFRSLHGCVDLLHIFLQTVGNHIWNSRWGPFFEKDFPTRFVISSTSFLSPSCKRYDKCFLCFVSRCRRDRERQREREREGE